MFYSTCSHLIKNGLGHLSNRLVYQLAIDCDCAQRARSERINDAMSPLHFY